MVRQLGKSVRDTSNYQNFCRNTLDLIIGLSYKAANLDILTIPLVCRWQVFQNWVTNVTGPAKINHVSAKNCLLFSTLLCHNLSSVRMN